MRSLLRLTSVTSFMAITPLLLRLPMRHLERLLLRGRCHAAVSLHEVTEIVGTSDRICRLGCRLIRHKCTVRGLTLFYFLRKAGVELDLVFGVGSVKEKFAAHCWLAVDGEPYLETVDPRLFFTPMYVIHGQRAGRSS